MAKKKKKKVAKRREMQEEAKEELEVLAAIFGDQFTLDEDVHGFRLHIVPHPGRTEPNYVSVHLTARFAADQPCLRQRWYRTHALALEMQCFRYVIDTMRMLCRPVSFCRQPW